MKRLLILLIPLMVSSCSPQMRLTRLLERHPELMKTDTTTIVEYDTVVQYKLRIVPYYLPGSTLYGERISYLPMRVPEPILPDTAVLENRFCLARSWVSLDGRKITNHLQLTQKDTILQFRLDSALVETEYWKEKYVNITHDYQTKEKVKLKDKLEWFGWGVLVGLFTGVILFLFIRLKII